MASYNRVVLVGNLTRDVEPPRFTASSLAIVEISLAVNERFKRNEQWVEEVHFFNVTLFGRTAEVAAEYLSKGSSVLIEGRLKHDRWEKDGEKKSKISIVGEKLQMLGSRGGGGGGNSGSRPHSAPATTQAAAPAQTAPPDDEVPF